MGLFEFYRSASDYVAADPAAVEASGESRTRHTTYHRWIVLMSCAFGAGGAVFGIFSWMAVPKTVKSDHAFEIPFLFGAGGLLLGVAVACLFAPRDFLTGPLGKKWMRLIGTSNVLLARIMCLVLGLVIVAPLIEIGLLLASAK